MSKKKTYIDEFAEWQNHQFDPGHYTGANMNPSVKAEGNPLRAAIIHFFGAGIAALYYFFNVIEALKGNSFGSWNGRLLSKLEHIGLYSLIFIPFILLGVWLGLRYCQKAKKLKLRRKMIAQSRRKKKSHKR